MPLEKVESELREQHAAIENFSDHEEVVLWFEHDLFCQVHLIYLLAWFGQRDLGKTKLSLISIDQFPGVKIFHGLGQLDGRNCLRSCRSTGDHPGPTGTRLKSLACVLSSRCLTANLADGIGSFGAAISARRSHKTPAAVSFNSQRAGPNRKPWPGTRGRRLPGIQKAFPRLHASRAGIWLWRRAILSWPCRRLATARVPLLKQKNADNSAHDPLRMLFSAFEITERGQAVLAGAEDFVIKNGIDLWLGGVHLQGKESQWRWDDDTEQLLVSL